MSLSRMMTLQPMDLAEWAMSLRKEAKVGVGVVLGTGILAKILRYVYTVYSLKHARERKRQQRDEQIQELKSWLEKEGKVSE